MAIARTIFTLAVAISLAALPARVGAVGIPAAADVAVSSMSDCGSMDDGMCEAVPAAGIHVAAGDPMPMSGGCDRPGDHGAGVPGACSTYCNSVSALPAIIFPALNIAVVDSVTPAVAMIMNGIGVSPEPHPPKLV